MQIETPQAVAIYCRLSKEDLDENKIDNLSRSIQNQKSMLTDFAEINGWQIFDIYCDDNLSGVARDRPEFNRLIRDASLRKFNIILCKNQSRFTRDMQLVEKYIHGGTLMKTQDNRDRIAAIYVRLSEEDHDKVHETDDSLSIQNQKSMLLEFASKHGWTV